MNTRAEWLTVADAADLISVSIWTMREMVADKRVKATYFGPRALRVSRSSLDKLAEKNLIR